LRGRSPAKHREAQEATRQRRERQHARGIGEDADDRSPGTTLGPRVEPLSKDDKLFPGFTPEIISKRKLRDMVASYSTFSVSDVSRANRNLLLS